MVSAKTPFLLLLLGAFFAFPFVSFAEVIFNETDETTEYRIIDGATGGAYVRVYQELVAEKTGPIKFIEFYGARNTSGTNKSLVFSVKDLTGASVCQIIVADTTGNNTNLFNEIPTGSASDTTLLQWDTDAVAGSDCDTYNLTEGTVYRVEIAYAVDGAFMDGEFYTRGTSPDNFFFRAYDEPNGPEGESNTRVLRINTPLLYATTTSPYQLSFDYYNGSPANADSYSAVAWKIEDAGGYSRSVSWWERLSTTTEGVWTYSTTTSLLPPGTWKVTITLTDEEWRETSSDYSSFVQTDGQNEVIYGVDVMELDNHQRTVFGPAVFQGYASTSCNINFLGTFNLSDCVGYLFIPSQNLYQNYQNIGATFGQKFPFSYAYSIAQVWQQLSTSGTENSPTLEYNLHDLGIGSTTPMGNFLPNFTVFSASTTQEYFPSGTFDLLKGLASIAIILSFFLYMFFEIKHLIKT